MKIFERLKMGITLTVDSLQVMRHNPKLFLFPLVSGVAGLAFLGLFLGITFGAMRITPEGAILAGLLVVYLGLTFISSFFAAGLVHQTRETLAGNDPDLRAGLAAAWDVRTKLLIYSAISATVGVIINAIENSDSRVARIAGTIFGAAWTLLTFFVIPVIVFEETGIKGMFTESASTFKETWGETPISLIGVQLVSFVVAVPFLVLAFLLSATSTVGAIAAALTGFLLAFLIGQTLQGVIKTTLYLYATEGVRPREFDNVDFDKLSDSADGKQRKAQTPKFGGFQ